VSSGLAVNRRAALKVGEGASWNRKEMTRIWKTRRKGNGDGHGLEGAPERSSGVKCRLQSRYLIAASESIRILTGLGCPSICRESGRKGVASAAPFLFLERDQALKAKLSTGTVWRLRRKMLFLIHSVADWLETNAAVIPGRSRLGDRLIEFNQRNPWCNISPSRQLTA